ncbi:MAG: hypothetical protein CL609_15105 [Anaerolineaceae bacterium]|nr:hypothetical protein [Anaerolineaceae bacterium]
MQILNIFSKDIHRYIEGVIKADDESGLLTEAEEYVLTNEVSKHLETFFEVYNGEREAVGVWISGFFGSGKSHLLKMLALLLENRTINKNEILNLFIEKCEENGILKGAMQKAASIPSHSILFNIDQKADVVNRNQADAVLSVFLKVFDEACGYYGKQAYIAQFERDLDQRGLLNSFREVYASIAKIPWEEGRELAFLEYDNVDAAYRQVSGASESAAKGILDKYKDTYQVSIEDFAEKVNDYIQTQGENFRLNFFVDEVGQYVADNIKLMTNLQTISESLATRCKGRAWIIVTAQEDMDKVLGEMNNQQANDFSKIMARFSTRMKLTGKNVDEVIQKRLLKKNTAGEPILERLYAQEKNNFKTLFSLSAGSQTYRNFRTEEDFVNVYPFVPYQFPLFQTVIKNLSEHNAFEGRHSSVGERSMLGVFQEVVKTIAKEEIGKIATFDLMYEGIRSALKTHIQQAILTAEAHLENDFAVRVLKVLFLVKYVKEFKSDLHNLTVLLLDGFRGDPLQLRGKIDEALQELVNQNYIQRNGDIFEFLTNEERDIEAEIKAVNVETTDLLDEFRDLFFTNIVGDRKLRVLNSKQDFPFTQRVDEIDFSRPSELTIQLISPFNPNAGNLTTIKAHSMDLDRLVVVLPTQARLMEELLMYKKTDKFVKQNNTTVESTRQRILSEKAMLNKERAAQLKTMLSEAVKDADLIISGEVLDLTSSDPKTRILNGFEALVKRTYPNLQMLRGIEYQTEEVGRMLRERSATLFGNDTTTLSEAENEMLSVVNRDKLSGIRTTMDSLSKKFEKKPYGWPLAAVQCIAAKIIARGKLEISEDGVLLEGTALEQALKNTGKFQNLILVPQVEYPPSQVRWLKDFYKNFFNKPAGSTDPRALAKETKTAFKDLVDQVSAKLMASGSYGFLDQLAGPLETLRSLEKESYDFYLTKLKQQEEVLFLMKENTLQPIFDFMDGERKNIYDGAVNFLRKFEKDAFYLSGNEFETFQAALSSPTIFKGNELINLAKQQDQLSEMISTRCAAEQTEKINLVREKQNQVLGMQEFAQLDGSQQEKIKQVFEKVVSSIQTAADITSVTMQYNQFETALYQQILERVVQQAAENTKPAVTDTEDEDGGSKPKPVIKQISQIFLPVGKPLLQSADDVENYISGLKTALLEEINQGTKIQI